MQDIFNNMGFIIAFLVLVLLIQMSLGSEVANKFLILVLLGMLLFNADKITNLIEKSFSIK